MLASFNIANNDGSLEGHLDIDLKEAKKTAITVEFSAKLTLENVPILSFNPSGWANKKIKDKQKEMEEKAKENSPEAIAKREAEAKAKEEGSGFLKKMCPCLAEKMEEAKNSKVGQMAGDAKDNIANNETLANLKDGALQAKQLKDEADEAKEYAEYAAKNLNAMVNKKPWIDPQVKKLSGNYKTVNAVANAITIEQAGVNRVPIKVDLGDGYIPSAFFWKDGSQVVKLAYSFDHEDYKQTPHLYPVQLKEQLPPQYKSPCSMTVMRNTKGKVQHKIQYSESHFTPDSTINFQLTTSGDKIESIRFRVLGVLHVLKAGRGETTEESQNQTYFFDMGTHSEKVNSSGVYNLKIPFKTSAHMPSTFTPWFTMQYSIVVETPFSGIMGKVASYKTMPVPTSFTPIIVLNASPDAGYKDVQIGNALKGTQPVATLAAPQFVLPVQAKHAKNTIYDFIVPIDEEEALDLEWTGMPGGFAKVPLNIMGKIEKAQEIKEGFNGLSENMKKMEMTNSKFQMRGMGILIN